MHPSQELTPDMAPETRISTELVPLQYGREAWNIIHGTSLETHSNLLTEEQAAQINSENDIVLAVGDHGQSKRYAKGQNEIPTDREFWDMAHFVKSLQPGDVLFIEYSGFRQQRTPPAEAAPAQPEQAAKQKGRLRQMLGKLALGSREETTITESPALKKAREEREVDLWAYAGRYAEERGITVLHADIDEYTEHTLTSGRDIFDIARSEDAADQALMAHIDSMRERAARNIVKDWALAHPADNQWSERKRRLVLLFGDEHTEGLKQTFADIDLQTHVRQFRTPRPYERAFDYKYNHSGLFN